MHECEGFSIQDVPKAGLGDIREEKTPPDTVQPGLLASKKGTSGARPWTGGTHQTGGTLARHLPLDPCNQIPAFSWMRHVSCTCSTAGTVKGLRLCEFVRRKTTETRAPETIPTPPLGEGRGEMVVVVVVVV